MGRDGADGLAALEQAGAPVFVEDPDRLTVIEINARYGGGFPLSLEAGADFPRWMLEELRGLPSTASPDGWRAGLVMLRYDAAVFVDERGQRINGQWTGSPAPVQHDILTGSNADGTLMAGFTCADWTSASDTAVGQVGHSDGMGPGQSTAGALASWNSAHANQNCANTAPRGGAGRIYCFAR